jgi:hypothetical protein
VGKRSANRVVTRERAGATSEVADRLHRRLSELGALVGRLDEGHSEATDRRDGLADEADELAHRCNGKADAASDEADLAEFVEGCERALRHPTLLFGGLELRLSSRVLHLGALEHCLQASLLALLLGSTT